MAHFLPTCRCLATGEAQRGRYMLVRPPPGRGLNSGASCPPAPQYIDSILSSEHTAFQEDMNVLITWHVRCELPVP